MARPIVKPKTTSQPAHSDLPSLLTTLPPEVRNSIYEVLFGRDEHIMIHNADTYLPRHPERQPLKVVESRFRDTIRAYDKAIEEYVPQNQEFKHGLGVGLSLLLSCCQVYHECAGVLYGSNTFVVSRTFHRHDKPSDPDLDYDEGYDQFEYVPVWLSRLGNQINLVR